MSNVLSIFPAQRSGTKTAKKVVLILCAGTPENKNFSIFSKKFAFTPLQNRNFRYNNHRPVRLCSSVGRAGDGKSPCHWFDSDRRHQQRKPIRVSQYAAVAHLVERHLAKVEVASSSLVGRSIKEQQQLLRYGPVAQLVRAPACHAGGRRFEPDPGRFVESPAVHRAVLQARLL